MALDFSSARTKHAAWKSKLRDFLDGKGTLTVAQATSHKDCDLGKWLYSEGLAKFSKHPEMKALEKEHETLHHVIKAVMEHKHAGRKAEAEAEFAKVAGLSKRIIDLLTAVETKVEAKAA